ncbi:hypothetical protein CEXT_94511 [Caerostris extrusa]|uniref:Uncharacterized protein n=1 Tax=Caerostris extrusa TaxID=172846 RepID=A0AAV4XYW1_CAEEX|nr:hypothetical protein CEXT_94511 [Caerostris extrusa]
MRTVCHVLMNLKCIKRMLTSQSSREIDKKSIDPFTGILKSKIRHGFQHSRPYGRSLLLEVSQHLHGRVVLSTPGYVGEWPMPRVQLEAPYSPARYDDPTEDPGYERSVRSSWGRTFLPIYPFPYVHRRLPTPPPRRREGAFPARGHLARIVTRKTQRRRCLQGGFGRLLRWNLPTRRQVRPPDAQRRPLRALLRASPFSQAPAEDAQRDQVRRAEGTPGVPAQGVHPRVPVGGRGARGGTEHTGEASPGAVGEPGGTQGIQRKFVSPFPLNSFEFSVEIPPSAHLRTISVSARPPLSPVSEEIQAAEFLLREERAKESHQRLQESLPHRPECTRKRNTSFSSKRKSLYNCLSRSTGDGQEDQTTRSLGRTDKRAGKGAAFFLQEPVDKLFVVKEQANELFLFQEPVEELLLIKEQGNELFLVQQQDND